MNKKIELKENSSDEESTGTELVIDDIQPNTETPPEETKPEETKPEEPPKPKKRGRPRKFKNDEEKMQHVALMNEARRKKRLERLQKLRDYDLLMEKQVNPEDVANIVLSKLSINNQNAEEKERLRKELEEAKKQLKQKDDDVYNIKRAHENEIKTAREKAEEIRRRNELIELEKTRVEQEKKIIEREREALKLIAQREKEQREEDERKRREQELIYSRPQRLLRNRC